MADATRLGRSFIGRPEVLDALRRRSDAVRAGRGGFAVVEGEAGVGKSVLIDGFVEEARSKGVRVLIARALSMENPPPYRLVREALRSLDTPTESAEPMGNISTLAFAPTALAGPSSGFAPTRGPESWLLEDHVLEPFGGAGDMGGPGRQRADTQIAGEFLALGDRAPTIVVLEDVHLADEASLETLTALAPQLATHALWLVTTRLPLSALAGTRRARLETIERTGEAEPIVIRPFTPSEVTDFIREELEVTDATPEEVTRWHSQSGGNPLFLEQLVRRRGDLATPSPHGTSETPAQFAEYLAKQLQDLPPDQERVLAVASILGRDFPFALLLRAGGEDEETLAELIQELVGRGVLREKPDEVLEFPRDDLRAQIYGRLTEARRRLLHKRAGEALEAFAPADETTVYALARHYFLGKVDDRAASYNRIAGELAAKAFEPDVARRHFERALESLQRLRPRDPSAELEVALELAVELDRLGELERAEGVLTAAIPPSDDLSVPASLRAVATISLARICSDQGRWDEVERATTELMPRMDATWSPKTRLALHRLRGELLYYYGRYEESLGQHDQALAIAQAQHDDREAALETVRRANVLGMIPGRFEEAVRDYHRVIEALKARGDDGEAAYALVYLGVVLSQNERVDEGLVALEQARDLAEKAHDPRRLGWALFNIADLERERGNTEVARTANRRAREILEKVGDRFGLVQTQIVEGKVRLQAGDLTGAHYELLEAYRLVRELNVPADEAEVVLRLAEVSLARGDPRSARTRSEELRRLGIERLRPDLVQDYQKFLARLPEGGTSPAV